ncbi:MAG: DNA-binding domain-containing protein [Ramlibacter sp.]
MSCDPAQFQSAFADALLDCGPQPRSPLQELVSQPAFAVYRNSVMKGCIDALAANFPAVVRLVGEQWFRAVALDYATWQPPDDPRLLSYGRSFPDFLQLCAAARELPYLAGVARLDRCWIEAHVAADAETDTSALAALSPGQLGATVVAPHPAARWRWFAVLPIFTLWSRNRIPDSNAGELPIEWHGEGALLTRPRDAVLWRAASGAECVFLDACAAPRGATLADAAGAAIGFQPDVDLAALLAGLLRAGALVFPSLPLAGNPS